MTKSKEDELFFDFLDANPGALALYNMVLQGQAYPLDTNPEDRKSRLWLPNAPSKSPRKPSGNTVPPKSPGKPMMMPPKSPGKPMMIPPKSPGKSMKPPSAVTGRSPKKSVSVTNVLGKSPSKPNYPVGKSPQKSYSVLNVGYNSSTFPNNKRASWVKDPEINNSIPENSELPQKVFSLHNGPDSKRNISVPLTDVSNSIPQGVVPPTPSNRMVFTTMDTIAPLNDVVKQTPTCKTPERSTSRVGLPVGQGTKPQPPTTRSLPPIRVPPSSQKAEQERKEQERKEQERKEQERKEQERKEQERKEQERKEQERKEQERKEQERKDQERKEQERKEQERKEQERKEQEKKEQERKEQERKEQEKKEKERKEQEKKEQEKREKERKEQEKKDQEKKEQEKKEKERREQERRDQERREQERKEQEKREQEKRERDMKEQSEQDKRESEFSMPGSSVPKINRSKSDPNKSRKDVVPTEPCLNYDRMLEMLEGLTDPATIFNHALNIAYGVDIRDRSYHLKRYKETLVAEELVSWLVGHKIAATREKAAQIGKEICRLGLIEHVTKSHDFEDAHQFYVLTTKGKFTRKEQALPYFSNVFDASNGVEIKDRNWGGMKKYKSCFVGQEFVDWFLREGQVNDRSQALKIGRAFLEADLIEHVTQDHHFKDAQLCYHLTRKGIIRRMQGNSTTARQRRKSRAEPQKILPNYDGQKSDTSQPTEHSSRTPNNDPTLPSQTNTAPVPVNPPVPFLTVSSARPSATQLASAQVVAMASQKIRLPQPNPKYEDSSIGGQDYSLSDDTDIDAASNISVLEKEEESVRTTGGVSGKGRMNGSGGKINFPSSPKPSGLSSKDCVPADFSLENHLGDPSGVRYFRQYLIKACRFQEADSVDFLTEIFHLKKEISPKNQSNTIRQIFQTYICDSSTNFIPLPKSLTNTINTLVNERNTSPNVFDDAQEYVLGTLRTLVQDYCKSPQFTKWMEEKGVSCTSTVEKTTEAPPPQEKVGKSSDISPNDSFLDNLDFCYAVSAFKVNFISKTIQERQIEAEQISGKYFGLNGNRRLINVLNTTAIDEVTKMIKSGTIKVDLFDKTLADVATVLNKGIPSKNSSTSLPPISNPTPSVSSVPPPNSVPRSSGPSQTVEPPAKSSEDTLSVVTPSVPVSTPSVSVTTPSVPVVTPSIPVSTPSIRVISAPTTSAPSSSAPSTNKFSIVVRRFNKRGGIRVILPDTIQELLTTASEKLKVNGVKIREPETEAEIPDLSFLKPDMVVWLMTAEEEEEFC